MQLFGEHRRQLKTFILLKLLKISTFLEMMHHLWTLGTQLCARGALRPSCCTFGRSDDEFHLGIAAVLLHLFQKFHFHFAAHYFCMNCHFQYLFTWQLDVCHGANVEVCCAWWTPWTLQDLNIWKLWFGHGWLRFTLRNHQPLTTNRFSLAETFYHIPAVEFFFGHGGRSCLGEMVGCSTPEAPSERTCDLSEYSTRECQIHWTQKSRQSLDLDILGSHWNEDKYSELSKNDNHPLEPGNLSSICWKLHSLNFNAKLQRLAQFAPQLCSGRFSWRGILSKLCLIFFDHMNERRMCDLLKWFSVVVQMFFGSN